VFDDGRLTASGGHVGDMKNCIFIMTSNLGSEIVERRELGFGSRDADPGQLSRKWLNACGKHFRPELLNRIDRIVPFRFLGRDELRVIAKNELETMLQRVGLERRQVVVQYRDDVLDLITAHGFSQAFGARPIKRTIQDLVLLPLSRRIAAQPAVSQMLFELRVSGNGVAFVPIPIKRLLNEPSDQSEDVAPSRSARAGRAVAFTDLRGRAKVLAAGLRERLDSSRFVTMESEHGALLGDSRSADFWRDPVAAQEVMSRIYYLDRQIALFRDLAAQVDSLAEALARPPGKVTDADVRSLQRRLEDLEREARLATDECAPDGLPDVNEVVMTITPLRLPGVGAPEEWPRVVRDMYVKWATRRGYEVEDLTTPTQTYFTIYLRGPGLHGLLRGETGLHRVELMVEDPRPDGPQKLVRLAAVAVVPLADSAASALVAKAGVKVAKKRERAVEAKGGFVPVLEAVLPATGQSVRVQATVGKAVVSAYLLALQENPLPETPSLPLVRQVHRGKTSFVKDKRTGHKSRRVEPYLNGELDEFLEAAMGPPA
jgi:ATP-dependent Clp protease ATP-binding subunit ClpC